MTSLLILATIAVPLLLAAGHVSRFGRRHRHVLLPFAATPALALALFGTAEVLMLPWLLEGVAWGLDDERRVLLTFTGIIWTVAGIYAWLFFREDGYPRHLSLYWCLSLCGNLGLILARDVASFYTFFSLMTLSAYGLITQGGDQKGKRAGYIYLVMALCGEMVLLAGLIMAAAPDQVMLLDEIPAAVAASDHRTWVVALLVCGFGVKAGLPLLHMWMPLAYAAAPAPCAAVLGGAMLNAGLIGWIYTLPLGHVVLEGWAIVMISVGLLAVFGAALPGLCQREPGAVLAYSSVGQMGFMTVMIGVGFADPAAWESIAAAVLLYAMHHGLVKATLFLSAGAACGTGARGVPFWIMAWLPALSLTGMVITSGAAAKGALKDVLEHAGLPAGTGHTLGMLLSAGAVVTTLLVARFLWRLRYQPGRKARSPGLSAVLGLAVACSMVAFWWLPRPAALLPPAHPSVFFPGLTDGLATPFEFLWPPAAGLILAGLAVLIRLRPLPIPPGDLLLPAEAAGRHVSAGARCAARTAGRIQARVVGYSRDTGKRLLRHGAGLLDLERKLKALSGASFAIILALLLILLVV